MYQSDGAARTGPQPLPTTADLDDSHPGYENLVEDRNVWPVPSRFEAQERSADPGGLVAQGQEAQRWLLLVYRVPHEPTRLRSMVWRRIKRLGAIYLQNSAAGLPESASAERAMRKLRHAILDMSGSAVLLSCEVLAGESDITAAFQSARNDEYEEITDRCADFIANLDKICSENQVSYAKLDEKEIELAKLRKWLQRVRDRDVIGTNAREAACSRVAECETKLDAYAARVYAEESSGDG